MASASGDSRPTMRTETVCREFCSVYASMTGTEALVSSHISDSHDLHGGRPGSTVSTATSECVVSVEEGFGRSAEVSVGRLSVGVTVSEDDPLGMLSQLFLSGSLFAVSIIITCPNCNCWTSKGVGLGDSEERSRVF